MSNTSTPQAQTDMLRQLAANTKQGVYSHILYDRGDGTPASVRVIEPRHVFKGIAGDQLWAMQIEPTRRLRHFDIDKITKVEPSDQSLPAGGQHDFNPNAALSMQTNGEGEDNAHPMTSVAWFVTFAALVREAVADLHLPDEEVHALQSVRDELGLSPDQVRAVYAYVFAEFLLGYAGDGRIGADETQFIQQLSECFKQLGWPIG